MTENEKRLSSLDILGHVRALLEELRPEATAHRDRSGMIVVHDGDALFSFLGEEHVAVAERDTYLRAVIIHARPGDVYNLSALDEAGSAELVARLFGRD